MKIAPIRVWRCTRDKTDERMDLFPPVGGRPWCHVSDRGRQLMSRPEYLFPRGLHSSPRLSKLQQPLRSSRYRQSGRLRPWYACRWDAAYEVLRVTELLTPSVVGAVAALQRRREPTQRPRMVAVCPTGSGGSFTRLVPARSGGFAPVNFWRRCCSVCRSEMRHLVCVCLHEGRAGRGARDIVTTGGMSRQPVEPIDKAQHIRHEYIGDGESPG